ncbi:hypothetical protein ACJIZ3_019123 [Penstemon smallii]|uniref:Uncharacterized protein n=1 Tax=Penstemon smallii TaxID=265156 RepID=A0ABD3T139_9LAMI
MNDTRNELNKLPMPNMLRYISILWCQPQSTHWDRGIWLVNQPVFYSGC